MAWRGIVSRGLYLPSLYTKFATPILLCNSYKFRVVTSSSILVRGNSIASDAHGETDVSCWKCGADIRGQVLCKECSTIQKPDREANYFGVFSFPPTYHIDPKDLTTRFRKLQMQLHPDRFSRKGQAEQDVSAEYSSLVNRAYKTLLDPIERGNYLLQLHGIPLQEGEMHIDPDFLMEIMEINENLADAEEHGVDQLDSENQEVIEKLLNDMSRAFKDGRTEDARTILAKIKYYANIAEKIKEMKHSLLGRVK